MYRRAFKVSSTTVARHTLRRRHGSSVDRLSHVALASTTTLPSHNLHHCQTMTNPLSLTQRHVGITTRSTAFFSTSSSSSSNNDDGERLYQEYLQLKTQLDDFRQEKERSKSAAMFQAWQQQQERRQLSSSSSPKTNPRAEGVAVVKTLVQETKKEQAAAQDAAAHEHQVHAQAQQALQQAALEYGHAAALVQLGNQTLATACQDVRQAKPFIDKTLDLYELAGQGGSKEGWFNHGHLLWTGFPDQTATEDLVDEKIQKQLVVLSPDQAAAMASFEKAIELGDFDAMYFVGTSLVSTIEADQVIDTDKDDDPRLVAVKRGLRLIERAATEGPHGGALYFLALFHLAGHVALGIPPCTGEEFRRRLDAAVEADSNEDALFLRGHSWYHGENGYARNYDLALGDFLQAADAGHADAAVSAGAMLHSGEHVPRDQHKAFELYQHAGELGSLEGWRNVAACYATGEGVAKSLEMAKYISKTMKLGKAK